MAQPISVPAGFEIDSKPSAQSTSLPDGFELDSQQSSDDIPIVKSVHNSVDDNSQQQAPVDPNEISGVNAVETEFGRGLQSGLGQLTADAGWLANGAGMFKNGIGTAINQYGQDMMTDANNIPQTNLPGIVKGVANIAGQAAPMLATFGVGEAAGLAKVGELATNAVGTLTNMRAAKYFSAASRAMGQGTLFGTINAIDTAASLPQSTDMKTQINSILDSGNKGFIAGATLSPLLEIGHKVLSKYGEKALRAYTVGITGSEDAADKVYDLTRSPGTYNSVLKVDPNAPEGQQITMHLSKAVDVTPEEEKFQHEQMEDHINANIGSVKSEHDDMAAKLTQYVNDQKVQFDSQQRAINQSVGEELSDLKLDKTNAAQQDYTKALSDSAQGLQQGQVGNSQILQTAQKAFEEHLDSTQRLNGEAIKSLYDSVIKTAPADGFSVQSIISNIKDMMQKEYGVSISKVKPTIGLPPGIRIEDLPKDQQAQYVSNRPATWVATSRAAGGQINANAAKVSKYLTETLLPDLEEKIKTNNGVYTLDMMRETTKNIKALGYEDGISNPGFASLDRVFRPNKNIGEIVDKEGNLNIKDKGAFIGSDASLSALKQAAMLDNKYATISNLADEYKSSVAGSVESKAKAFGKDIHTTETLAKLEGAMGMPVEDPLRLSNAMKSYYDKNNELLDNHSKNAFLLDRKLDIQKNAINDEISRQAFNKREERISKANTQRQSNIEARQKIVQSKSEQIRKLEAFKEQYKKTIEKAKFDRAAALNEVRTVGRSDTPLGRIQRGFVTGSGWGLLSGNIGAAAPAMAASAVLSPKVGVPIIRSILKSSRSGTLSKVNRGLKGISQHKILRNLIIGSSLKKN